MFGATSPGFDIWHSAVDVLTVYALLSVCGGTVLSVVLTWVITMVCVCVCVCVCVFVKQLPSNQSFDKQISSHQKGGGVSRWGEWVVKATAYKFDTCTLIGDHSTMHLVDPIKVHVSYQEHINYVLLIIYMYVCVCVCVRVCVCAGQSGFSP